jgi:putative inorganic carbon (HCO3(-)) transporter
MSNKGHRNQSDSFLFYLYLLFIILLPLPFGGDWPWAMGAYQVYVFLLGILWLVQYIRGKVELTSSLLKAKYVGLLFLVWLGYIAAQLLLSPDDGTYAMLPASISIDQLTVSSHITSTSFLMSLSYSLLFFLTLVLVNTRTRLKRLAVVIVFCGVLQAMYGSLMTLSGLEYSFLVKKETYIGVATGSFYNRNHYAAYLVMCLATGIGLMIAQLEATRTEGWRNALKSWVGLVFSPKFRLRLYLVIMVIALVLTHSRMGNTAFFSSLFIAGVIGLVFSRQAGRGVVILLTSLIIIDLFIVGAWFGIDKVVERIEHTSVESEQRDDVNRMAYMQWQDNKWTGTGLGTFSIAFPKYRENIITGFYKQTHNDYLQFATEVGVVGLVLLGCIVVPSFLMAVMAQYKRKDPLMRGMSFAAMMGIIAMLIHATVEFNFQIPPNAGMFVVLLGLCWISRFHRDVRS